MPGKAGQCALSGYLLAQIGAPQHRQIGQVPGPAGQTLAPEGRMGAGVGEERIEVEHLPAAQIGRAASGDRIGQRPDAEGFG